MMDDKEYSPTGTKESFDILYSKLEKGSPNSSEYLYGTTRLDTAVDLTDVQLLSQAFYRATKEEIGGIEEAMLDEHYCKLMWLKNNLELCADERVNKNMPVMKDLEGWKKSMQILESEIKKVEQ